MTMTGEWIPVAVIPLAVLGLLIARTGRDRRVGFAVTLTIVSTVVALWSCSMAGVFWNTAFDAAWALSLSAALALHYLPARSGIGGPRLRAALPGPPRFRP
jgi:hypothetical protein